MKLCPSGADALEETTTVGALLGSITRLVSVYGALNVGIGCFALPVLVPGVLPYVIMV